MSPGRAVSCRFLVAIASMMVLLAPTVGAAKQVTVPSVVGMKLEDALASLRRAGMQVMYSAEATSDASKHGKVTWQDPPGNAKVTDNTTGGLMVRIRYFQKPGSTVGGAPPPPTSVVPNVVGMTETEAERALAAVGLGKSWSSASKGVATSDPKLSGRVARQQPPAGASLARGKAVTVELYSGVAGASAVKAPRLVGLTNDEATRQLGAAGLAYRHMPETSSDPSTYGKVVRQDPPAGASVAKGSPITIWVGKPGDGVKVPGVSGMSLSDAQTALTRARLVPRLTPPPVPTTDSGRVDKVAQQTPAAGQVVAPGTTVQFKLYALDLVKVPSVMMARQAEAVAEIQKVGLVADVQRGSTVGGGAGRVQSQRPEKGASVVRGSKVTIVVSPGG